MAFQALDTSRLISTTPTPSKEWEEKRRRRKEQSSKTAEYTRQMWDYGPKPKQAAQPPAAGPAPTPAPTPAATPTITPTATPQPAPTPASTQRPLWKDLLEGIFNKDVLYQRRGQELGKVESSLDTMAQRTQQGQPLSLPEKHALSFATGTGAMQESIGGALQWMGAKQAGETVSQEGRALANRYGVVPAKPYSGWRSLIDPEVYATTISQSLPFMLAMIPAGMMGAGGLAAIEGGATIGGLGPFASKVVATIGGAAVNRVMESSLEAGSVYNDAKAMGMGDEEADSAANQTFFKNLPLVATDMGELITAFTPVKLPGLNIAGRMAKGGRLAAAVGKGLEGVGRLVATAGQEAAEEGVQEVAQRQALGQPVAMDTEMKTSMMAGATMGGGFGLAGTTFQHIQGKVIDRLPAGARQAFNGMVDAGVKSGMTEQQARAKALDAVTQTPAGAQIVEQVAAEVGTVAQEVEAELLYGQGPEAVAEEVAAQQTPIPETPKPPSIQEAQPPEVKVSPKDEVPAQSEVKVQPQPPETIAPVVPTRTPEPKQPTEESPPATMEEYQKAQDAIDAYEDQLIKIYGEDEVLHAPIQELTGAFKGMEQPTKLSLEHLNGLKRLYQIRDNIGKQIDENDLNAVLAHIPGTGPASKEMIAAALRELQQKANVGRVFGHEPNDIKALIDDIYVNLSHELARQGKLPDDFAGDIELAMRVARDWPNGIAKDYGQNPKPLLDQISGIVQAIVGGEGATEKAAGEQKAEGKVIEPKQIEARKKSEQASQSEAVEAVEAEVAEAKTETTATTKAISPVPKYTGEPGVPIHYRPEKHRTGSGNWGVLWMDDNTTNGNYKSYEEAEVAANRLNRRRLEHVQQIEAERAKFPVLEWGKGAPGYKKTVRGYGEYGAHTSPSNEIGWIDQAFNKKVRVFKIGSYLYRVGEQSRYNPEWPVHIVDPGAYGDAFHWKDTGKGREAKQQWEQQAKAGAEEAAQKETGQPSSVSGITVTENEARNGVEIRFPEKPPAETIIALRKQGFRYSSRQKLWYAQRTEGRKAFAYGLAEAEEENPTASQTPVERVKSEKEQSEKEVASPGKDATPGQVAASKVANFVYSQLTAGKSFAIPQLFRVAEEAYGGKQSEGKYTPKDAYDAMELGINAYIVANRDIFNPRANADKAKQAIQALQDLLNRIPTQTKRTAEQDEFQQFSTPPSIAYLAAWAANLNSNDTVLEPSAGIGGIAVFGYNGGAEVTVNELSPRRAALLKLMPTVFDRIFTENAEQLNNILPRDITPTVVLMNPPFSATAGRMQGARKTKFAEAHIEQALKRLEPNGRLVAIVGRGMSDDAPTFKAWWSKIKQEYNVRANVGIDGRNYAKYGTSFDIQLLVIDKAGVTPEGGTLTGSVTNLEEAIPLLEAVRNERERAGSGQPVKQVPGKPPVQETAGKGRGETGPGHAVPVATGALGNGEEETSGIEGGQSIRDQGSAGTTGVSNVSSGRQEGMESANERRPDRGPERNVDRPERPPGEEGPGGRSVDNTGRAGRSDDGGRTVESDAGRLTESEAEVEAKETKSEVKSSEIAIETKDTERSKEELTDATFTTYKPQRLKVPGAKKHPGALAQSAAMAVVEPPAPTYRPNLPEAVIKEGKLSEAQLEAVVYAGQSHEQTLPNGQRRGFFIGDGTGVGKGREISGIILDNWQGGRRKAVWVSKNAPLFEDAQRDFGDLGGDTSVMFELAKVKNGSAVVRKEGIMFATYDTLKQDLEVTTSGELKNKNKDKRARLDQVIEWLGEDFDGVIAFDEAHAMRNSLPMRGKRGIKKPSATALAGVELQKKLPNARVIYVSATGATEVENLGYIDRLGLWGTGTSFADKKDFIAKIQSGGLAAMELVARDMKALGLYIARTLDFNGVTYGTMEHTLTPEQVEVYDAMAEGWQIVLQNIGKALETTGQSVAGKRRRNAMAQFWSAQQRFFNQVLTSMQMPSVIKQVKEDIKDGKAVVMQLVNTNEAAQNRQIAKQEDDEGLENLDLTPREMLMQYLEKSFPTQQYETYTDENGNERVRAVVDSHGNPVHNQEALEMKEMLLAKLGAMKVPEGPLEMVINTFGVENVAEVTGRTKRVVRIEDENGRKKAVLETRTQKHAAADASAFMNDKKKILVFSDAGGTGRSYHADLNAKNQRRRVHYLIQAGWRADSAVQGFGRTHRTNEASAPHYTLVTTNLKGQKRFISTIARRLDQLGALTKGQRQTGSQGMFSAADNLEGTLAHVALERFYGDLIGGRIEGLNPVETLKAMGLEAMLNDQGSAKEDPSLRDVTKFLNRILSLKSDLQNRVFEEFYSRMERLIQIAQEDGTLDIGLENYKADGVVVKEEQTVYKDEVTEAETKWVSLEAKHKNRPTSFKEAEGVGFVGFYKNVKSGKVWAARNWANRTLESGAVITQYQLRSPASSHIIPEGELRRSGKFEMISRKEAEPLWEEALRHVPEYRKETVHLMTGALLPIWDRLPLGQVRVVRVRTDDGQVLLGRLIQERELNATLRRLGAGRQLEKLTPDQLVTKILDESYTVYLSNEWRIARRRVSGDYRIEIMGNNLFPFMNQLKAEGVFTERIQYETRFFIPTGKDAVEVMARVIRYRPVADIVAPERGAARSSEGQGGLSSIQEEFGHAVDDAVGDVTGENLGIVPEIFRPRPRNTSAQTRPGAFAFEDPDIEAEYQGSHGLQKPGVWQQVRTAAASFYDRLTREYEHLPHTAEFSQLRFDLNRLAKQKDIAKDKAARFIQGITLEMRKDPEAFSLFERAVLLEDLVEEVEMQRKDGRTDEEIGLPFGLAPETLAKEKARLDAYLQGKPTVRQSLETRRRFWRALKDDYIAAQKAIGFDVEDRFTRESYFRHQVLEWANARSVTYGTGQKLKTPTNRGFLKKRVGSSLNINTNYLEAELEVMAQMLYDIEPAKVIKLIDNQYNIARQLKQEAKRLNRETLQKIIDAEKQASESGELSETELTLKGFSQKMGMGFSQLRKLAEDGELWEGDKGEWAEVVQRLSEAKDPRISADRPGLVFNYLSALANLKDENGSMSASMILKAVSNRRELIREKLGKRFKTFEDIIPEGYATWQPRKGNVFFFADTIPSKLATELFSGALEELGIEKKDINRVLAMGQKFPEFVVKEEIALTLDNLTQPKPNVAFIEFTDRLLGAWKKWQLLSPRRLLKYNVRNLSGDAEAVFVGNPHAFTKVPDAMRELLRVYKGGAMTGEVLKYFEMGGFQSNLQMQEMGDINQLEMFKDMLERQQVALKNKPAAFARKVLMGYWKNVRMSTDFREAVLRYAAYLDNLEYIRKHGKPRDFGASLREEVMALRTPEQMAYKLSNDLLGAYDEVSVTGQWLRKHAIPFWSWNEVNFKRYIRLTRNAWQDGKICETAGRKILGAAANSPFIAMRIGKLFLKATTLAAILMAWNRLLWPDEERDLPIETQHSVHMVLGRDPKTGKVQYFTRLGILEDFLEWGGMQELAFSIPEWLNGRIGLKQVLINMVKSPANKLINGVRPEVKTAYEIASGKKVYPDIFARRGIRDQYYNLAQSLGIENEYAAMAGLPSKGYWASLKGIFIYDMDPGQAAYYDTLDEKNKFLKKLGKGGDYGGNYTPKSNALYNLKLAIRYGDKKAAEKYLLQYVELGGTAKGLNTSLRNMDPLFGMTETEQIVFVKDWLDDEGRRKLFLADDFYKNVLMPKKAEPEEEAAQ